MLSEESSDEEEAYLCSKANCYKDHEDACHNSCFDDSLSYVGLQNAFNELYTKSKKISAKNAYLKKLVTSLIMKRLTQKNPWIMKMCENMNLQEEINELKLSFEEVQANLKIEH